MTVRWHAKKLLRRAVARLPLAPSRPRGGNDAPVVRVLTYHRFDDRKRDPFAVAPAMFAEQVAALAASGVAVTLDAFERALAGQLSLPRGAVLLTIDDGHASTLAIAGPILARHGVPAVAFLSPGRLGSEGVPEAPERFLRPDEVRELAAFGIDVGAHGWSHRSLGRLGADALAIELDGARARLEDLLGREVSSFAYPFGTARDHSVASREAAAAAGYRLGFTAIHGGASRADDKLALPRVKIEGGEPLDMFHACCDGRLDAWRVVDRYGTALQARPRNRTGVASGAPSVGATSHAGASA